MRKVGKAETETEGIVLTSLNTVPRGGEGHGPTLSTGALGPLRPRNNTGGERLRSLVLASNLLLGREIDIEE